MPKPIIAMVHVQRNGNFEEQYDFEQQYDKVMNDVRRLERGGVDALLFENWGGDYIDRRAGAKAEELLRAILKRADCETKLPYGVNVLPLSYEAAFDLVKETYASFVQVDTFVDTVKTDYRNEFILEGDPQAILRYRRRLGLEDIPLFTNIQTKHYTTIPWNKKLETSAQQAIEEGADVLVVTGKSTGKKTPKEKLLRVKKVAGNTPVFIGSGLTVENAAELLPYADGAIVGTSLKYDGVTENPVEEERVRRLMDVVQRLR